MTDTQKLALVEIALDRRLTLATVKEWLQINHDDSDGALQLLIATFNLGCHTRWEL